MTQNNTVCKGIGKIIWAQQSTIPFYSHFRNYEHNTYEQQQHLQLFSICINNISFHLHTAENVFNQCM